MNINPVKEQFGNNRVVVLVSLIDLKDFESECPIGCILIVRSESTS